MFISPLSLKRLCRVEIALQKFTLHSWGRSLYTIWLEKATVAYTSNTIPSRGSMELNRSLHALREIDVLYSKLNCADFNWHLGYAGRKERQINTIAMQLRCKSAISQLTITIVEEKIKTGEIDLPPFSFNNMFEKYESRPQQGDSKVNRRYLFPYDFLTTDACVFTSLNHVR